MITIRGHEFEFNFLDGGNIDKVIKAKENVIQKNNELLNYKNGGEFSLEKFRDLLNDGCTMIFEFFDTILGEGTSAVIFEDRHNFEECLNTFLEFSKDFNSEMNKQTTDFKNKMINLTTPTGKKGK